MHNIAANLPLRFFHGTFQAAQRSQKAFVRCRHWHLADPRAQQFERPSVHAPHKVEHDWRTKLCGATDNIYLLSNSYPYPHPAHTLESSCAFKSTTNCRCFSIDVEYSPFSFCLSIARISSSSDDFFASRNWVISSASLRSDEEVEIR